MIRSLFALVLALVVTSAAGSPRERVSLNENWRFKRYGAGEKADNLIYEVRPEAIDARDDRPADAQPTEAALPAGTNQPVLKFWILPTGNAFIKDPAKRHSRPEGNPGGDFPFVQSDFDDSAWESVSLPHDWAIKGPFLQGARAEVGGSMGRLPVHGVAWYRRQIDIPKSDVGKSIFLDVDGAMSYAMVWLNGNLIGGWPYGYSSWRVDLTPYVVPGGTNQLAIRLDNPPNSSRWYPGSGIYRNVWLTKTAPVHVAHWGTFATTRNVSKSSAEVHLEVTIENSSESSASLEIGTDIHLLDSDGKTAGKAISQIAPVAVILSGRSKAKLHGAAVITRPEFWGPPPTQQPNRYAAITSILENGRLVDRYETRFGIRDLQFDPNRGLLVNGERIHIKGANQHHDLGALGGAFNTRAAERQLEMLREMGCNAIRMAHNPPARELLELTDRMGFLVVDEIFDIWEQKKTPLDFHLIFPDWHEQDLRAMIRRDRNHPSVILWSIGNEVGEQYTGEKGAAVAKRLHEIARDEDPTRPTTTSMNYAKPDMPLPAVMDVISLNYQGEGIRDAAAYKGLRGITTPPLYPAFRERFPGKLVVSSENAAALSSRGEYLFPVHEGESAPVREGQGGSSRRGHVSAYELYTADFGSSADKVFAAEEKHPFVAGGFIWSGWDYLGEPTPYYSSRSSYFGVIDLAGFKKDRFYLYQSHWRPELKFAHILPHWTWPERAGQITPVHVFTSGDEAELFLNGKSLGRKKKGDYQYRLRWNDVVYQPGTLRVVSYKNGKRWAIAETRTAAEPERLEMAPDRKSIRADGFDLSFITVMITDKSGLTAPRASNRITFEVDGPGEIIATDNGDPSSFIPFPSHEREAFNGLCLAIVRGKPGQPGKIRVTAKAPGLKGDSVAIETTKAATPRLSPF